MFTEEHCVTLYQLLIEAGKAGPSQTLSSLLERQQTCRFHPEQVCSFYGPFQDQHGVQERAVVQ